MRSKITPPTLSKIEADVYRLTRSCYETVDGFVREAETQIAMYRGLPLLKRICRLEAERVCKRELANLQKIREDLIVKIAEYQDKVLSTVLNPSCKSLPKETN